VDLSVLNRRCDDDAGACPSNLCACDALGQPFGCRLAIDQRVRSCQRFQGVAIGDVISRPAPATPLSLRLINKGTPHLHAAHCQSHGCGLHLHPLRLSLSGRKPLRRIFEKIESGRLRMKIFQISAAAKPILICRSHCACDQSRDDAARVYDAQRYDPAQVILKRVRHRRGDCQQAVWPGKFERDVAHLCASVPKAR